MMTRRLLPLLLALTLASVSPAAAQTRLADIGKRLQVSGNASYLWFSPTGGEFNWRGADLGGALTYSLGESFAVFGAYDHGFPFEGEKSHRNFARAMATLKLYPNASSGPSENALFIGVGRGWFGESDVKKWQTTEAQIVVAHKFADRVAGFASYAHSFGVDPENDPDLDFVKVGVNGRLFP
jgi:hypothetical protein